MYHCVPDPAAAAVCVWVGGEGGVHGAFMMVCNVVDGYHVAMHFVLSASCPLQCDCVTYSSTSVLLFLCDQCSH